MLIHMLAKHATHMYARRTLLGFVPASERTLVARTLSMFCLLRAAARVKPPSRSMMVGLNIWPNMYLGTSVSIFFERLVRWKRRTWSTR